jgi:hypothetical protein
MKRLSPLRAIRKFCLECAGSSPEVDLCTANPEDIERAGTAGDEIEYAGCPLYDYRKGHNPRRKGLGRAKPGEMPKEALKARNLSQNPNSRIGLEGKNLDHGDKNAKAEEKS